jgi:hypothetical protein
MCTIGKSVLTGGEFGRVRIIPHTPTPYYTEDTVERREIFLHVFGEIRYRDGRDISRLTSFHTIYNPRTKVFNVPPDTRHEYAY